MGQPILITGSAGFIGSHVCELLANGNGNGNGHGRIVGLDLASATAPRMFCADVRSPNQLRHIASIVQPNTVVHLAAKADVVIPYDELADLMATNVNGTINVLDTMHPERMVLASSSAVYGNASGRGALARWSCVSPLGAYGLSKAAAEFACAEWVRNTGGVAVSLRLGNVIGRRCRGLISYLVEHAIADPRGDRPAQLRGNGMVVRDYVPVAYVARVIKLATEVALPRGSSVIFNVGSGRGLTNRAVATVVQRVLASRGLKLTMEFSKSVAPGEAWRLVLEMAATARKLDLAVPTNDEVTEAIEEAALDCLALAG
jgi:nucleoside-diphosphate-sugar epimerase